MINPTDQEQAHGDEVRDALRGQWWIVDVVTVGKRVHKSASVRVRARSTFEAWSRARMEASEYSGWPSYDHTIASNWRLEDQ